MRLNVGATCTALWRGDHRGGRVMTRWPVLNRMVREAAGRQGIATVKQAGFVRWLDLRREDREQAHRHHDIRRLGFRWLTWGAVSCLLTFLLMLLVVHRARKR